MVSEIWLVRHGSTAWSEASRHTGRTDVPLSPAGEEAAAALRPKLAGVTFGRVLVSPLQRARRTAELAGFAVDDDHVVTEPLAQEWDYGDYEGLTREQIRERVPGWTPWHGEMPGGERLQDVAARAGKLLARIDEEDAERVLVVAHGHFLRILTTVRVGWPPEHAEQLTLLTSTVCVLGDDRGTPVVARWNA